MRPARKTSGLAALLLFAFALVFGATQPAAADPRLQTVSPCAKVTLSLNFNGVTGANCSGGVRFQSPTLLPGWTFTRASPETCQWASGDLTYAASGVPCITDLGLGVWESRTNVILQSQAFTNGWSNDTTTVTDNAVLAPDGTTTAASVVATGANLDVYRAFAGPTGAVQSWFVKAGTSTIAFLQTANTGNTGGRATYFNLATGTVGTVNSTAYGTPGVLVHSGATITPLVNGWFRISVVVTGDAANSPAVGFANADASRTITSGRTGSIWGAQLEAGAFPTPYIPTTTVAVTRAADVAFLPVTAQSAGALFTSWMQPTYISGQVAASLNDSTVNNRIQLDTSSGARLVVTSGGVTQATTNAGTSNAGGATVKFAISFAAADFKAARNGVSLTGVASGTVPTFTRLELGTTATLAPLNGYVGSAVLRPMAQTDAQLQAATQ